MINFKIALCGDGDVGKTSIILRYVKDEFYYDYCPILEDCYIKQISFENQELQVEILDCAGEQDPWCDYYAYVRDAQAIILVYSIDNHLSFQQIESIYQELIRKRDKQRLPCIICGNKSDLEDKRVITVAEGENLAAKLHCKFIETSALSNSNIDELFTILYKDLIKLPKTERNSISTDCCLLN